MPVSAIDDVIALLALKPKVKVIVWPGPEARQRDQHRGDTERGTDYARGTSQRPCEGRSMHG